MIEVVHGDLTWLSFESLIGQNNLVHAVTTKPANLAPHRGIGREQAVTWRKQFCEALGVTYEHLTSPEQVHGAEVLGVDASDVGCGRDGRDSAVRFVDGLITDRFDVPLILLSADCPLVCAFDSQARVIGAVHASWRGTVAFATSNLVNQMVRLFGCNPSRMLAAIAPSAGGDQYEVGEHVRRVARTRLPDGERFFIDRDGSIRFDLWEANRQQLIDAGVLPDRIEVAGISTLTDDRFWSHRRDGANAGRFALIMSLTA